MAYTFCPKCSAKVAWGSVCSKCGARIEAFETLQKHYAQRELSIRTPVAGGFRQASNLVKDSRAVVYSVLVAFLLFAVIGYLQADPFENTLRQLAYSWAPLLEKNTIVVIGQIIANNLRVVSLNVLLGIVFFPLLALILNPLLVGAACHFAIEEEGSLILWLLLPHGVFELPAVCISIAFGLRIGLSWFKRNRIDNFKRTYKEAFLVSIFIVLPLLVVAGIIEGMLLWIR